VIASNANTTDTGLKKRSNSLLDTKKSVLDGKRIHREIAKIGDTVLGEWIHVQDGVPRANDGGLSADISRSEARAGAIRGAAIEGHANESDLEFCGLGDVRQAHEGRDTGEAGEGEGIKRLGMRQAKGAAGFRHGEAS
jgi:hypothetical protein